MELQPDYNYEADSHAEVKRLNLEPFLFDSLKIQDVFFSAAPISTHLSQRSQMKLDYLDKQKINENLLQVTVQDRAMIFDLDRYRIDKNNEELSNYMAIREYSSMCQLI